MKWWAHQQLRLTAMRRQHGAGAGRYRNVMTRLFVCVSTWKPACGKLRRRGKHSYQCQQNAFLLTASRNFSSSSHPLMSHVVLPEDTCCVRRSLQYSVIKKHGNKTTLGGFKFLQHWYCTWNDHSTDYCTSTLAFILFRPFSLADDLTGKVSFCLQLLLLVVPLG